MAFCCLPTVIIGWFPTFSTAKSISPDWIRNLDLTAERAEVNPVKFCSSLRPWRPLRFIISLLSSWISLGGLGFLFGGLAFGLDADQV